VKNISLSFFYAYFYIKNTIIMLILLTKKVIE